MIHNMIHDVVIIGAGPAGLFAAYKLHELDRSLKVAIIDKGKYYEARECPVRKGNDECRHCKDCELISGEGGAGLFSDGKIVFTLDTGTNISYSQEEKPRILEEIKSIFERFNGDFVYKKVSKTTRENEQRKFKKVELKIDFYPVLHIGTLHLKNIMKNFLNYLRNQENSRFIVNTEVIGIRDREGVIKNVLIKSKNGDVKEASILGRNVIFAMGKEGSFSLTQWLKEKGLKIKGNRCYFGVRIELPTKIFKRLFDLSPNPKIHRYYDDGSHIKTHCFCKNGQILLLKYYGLPLVGGHTYEMNDFGPKNPKEQMTNFAVLLGIEMDYPEIIERSFQIMRQIQEITGGYLLVQRMHDFLLKVPSPSDIIDDRIKNIARPGNIADLDLPYDFQSKFIDFITQMNKIIPGVMDGNSLLYAPAIEWWMPKIETNAEMETKLKGIYVVGDGSGSSQGIVQSMATAVIAAKSVFNKTYYEKTREEFLRKRYHPSLQRDLRENISS